jgi:hypothetical protein
MRVVLNSLFLFLFMSNTKVSLVPDIFSFAVDRSWHFSKNYISEENAQMG